MSRMGNVSMERHGHDAEFQCDCGSNEYVKDFESGNKPKKFKWEITFKTEHASCLSCKKEYDNNIGQRYG